MAVRSSRTIAPSGAFTGNENTYVSFGFMKSSSTGIPTSFRNVESGSFLSPPNYSDRQNREQEFSNSSS